MRAILNTAESLKKSHFENKLIEIIWLAETLFLVEAQETLNAPLS